MKALIFTLILLLPMLLFAQTEWVKDTGNPVLDVGPKGSWDETSVTAPCVIVDGTTYKMWYTGYDSSNYRIGYATSSDGINWTKADNVNPVLDLGVADTWDNESVAGPCVLYDGDIYKMWYSGNNETIGVIGYATSPDGITWTKHDNPVLELGLAGSWDDVYIWGPKVLFVDSGFIMWYNGYGGDSNIRVGCARSTDGIVWTKEVLNPILSPTKHWERSYLYAGPVLYINNEFRMWYHAGLTNENLQTGYATSPDGINWTKADDLNPVLVSGPAGDWDHDFAAVSSIYFDGTKYHTWYDSYKYLISGAIGYATSLVDPTEVNEKISIPVTYELSQNYPNPFNPGTTVSYSIPSQSYVTLKVFDVLGREIAELVDEEQSVGNYSLEFDASNLNEDSYNIIQNLASMIALDHSIRIGTYEVDIFTITIKSLKTYEKELISL